MLDPEYIKTVTDELENYFYDLETDILSDIAERIRLNAGKMTSTAQYQLEQLKALGVVDNRVNSYLSKALKKSDKEVEKLILESAYKSVEADNVIFKEAYDKKLITSFSYNKNDFKDLISKGIAATTKDIKNICQTTAQTSRKQLTSAMNMAYLQVSSGAFSPDQAIENAVLKLMKEGLDWIDYKSGTHRHLDSSIRQALRTSINQTALKCQDQNFEALGGNLVEVSSHLGARPSHAQWQGKIYWRKEKYKNYSNFEESTGYGKIDGLGGVNCRHSYFPYFPGLSTKSFEHYSKKENEELYDLQQQQRYNERKIREWKRRQKVKSSAGLDTSKETMKVREWSQRNKKLIDSDSRLKRNYGREKGYVPTLKIDLSGLARAGKNDKINLMMNEEMSSNFIKMKPLKKYSDVICHTDVALTGFVIDSNNGVSIKYSPKELANIIEEIGGIEDNKGIRLISCSAAKGDDSLAQRLSNATGKKVLAPTETIWADTDGSYIISDNDVLVNFWWKNDKNIKGTGHWKLFKPKKGD